MISKFIIKDIGLSIGRYGFGCAASGGHGWGEDTGQLAVEAIRVAFDNGIDFFDTSDIYGLGVSEERLYSALGDDRHKVVIATKGGMYRDQAQGRSVRDCSKKRLTSAVEYSLKRLRLETIPLYYAHWPDKISTIEEIMGTLMGLRQEGKIQAIGLSNFSPEDVSRACKIGPVAAVQARLNLLMLDNAHNYLKLCQEHGIIFVAWGGLCDGLLTGKYGIKAKFSTTDHRSRAPHFQGRALIRNLEIVQQLGEVSKRLRVPLSSLALRALVHMYEKVCVLFGAKTPEQALQNCQDLNVPLSQDVIARVRSILYL
ncbi:MAG: hypothetical protein C0403_06740 [Desulfobacterium sp.]|nr:hypothetical protein [Desulfobacterium sp.]